MKEKDSASEPKINGRPRGGVRKGGGDKMGRVKSDKLLVEIEHYGERVADNEERLRTGKTLDGTPLTDLQRRNLEEITARQRERLLDLSG
jgi:hypothetical protein